MYLGYIFIMFLLNKFKEAKWENLTPAKRQTVLEKLEKKMAKRAGRPVLPISIVTDKDWYCYGMFESSGGKEILHLNMLLISRVDLRFQAMATVLHEGRHATQHFISKNDPAWFQFKARRWKKNMNNYISSREDKNLYLMQEVERDAQLFTIKKMFKWRFKYENEKEFENTYKLIKYQFEKSEQDAKDKYGAFYKSKINRAIKKRNRRKYY